jgi:hypothetical protein
MQNWIITLVFEKNANFFAENCLKSQKIVIITSTPGILKFRKNEIFDEGKSETAQSFLVFCI